MTRETKHHHAGKWFRNSYPGFRRRRPFEMLKWIVRRQRSRLGDPFKYRPRELAENARDHVNSHDSRFFVTWLGHSTVFTRLDGLSILTDPIWSERASPLSWAGPKRYTPPSIALEDLPSIDVVVISHDHYDHLDRRSIVHIGNGPLYLVPLGLKRELRRHGITHVRELDWWESVVYGGVRFTCTPAQHNSGRRVMRLNRSLWCGWAVNGTAGSFYFAGDTGYFPGFKDIGRRLGPFDLTLLPIGAYLPRRVMSPVHLGPKEAVTVHHELGGSYLLPIHWGTYELADEPPYLPAHELRVLAEEGMISPDSCWILKHGETRCVANAAGRTQVLFD